MAVAEMLGRQEGVVKVGVRYRVRDSDVIVKGGGQGKGVIEGSLSLS